MGPVAVNHLSTFETLAMEPELKEAIKKDLDLFLNMKEYYKKVGKAWKRGYLLYGPLGTGKSSYLNFLQLAAAHCHRKQVWLRTSTAPSSWRTGEKTDSDDDDDGKKKKKKEEDDKKITLLGILNFIDGLWSSCRDKRIIIFTTNHKEKLDPALLWSGRMDMHIHISYWTFAGFKLLASNFHNVEEHCLFVEIEDLMKDV